MILYLGIYFSLKSAAVVRSHKSIRAMSHNLSCRIRWYIKTIDYIILHEILEYILEKIKTYPKRPKHNPFEYNTPERNNLQLKSKKSKANN